MRRHLAIIQSAWDGWNRNRGGGMSASLAFYGLLSLVPLITVAMSLATWSLGSTSARWIVHSRVQSMFGEVVAGVFDKILDAGFSPGETVLAAAFGLLALLSGVSGMAGELRSSLNTVWAVPTEPESLMDMVRNRTRAAALVLALAVLVLAISVVSIATAAAGKFVSGLLPAPEWALTIGNLGLSLTLLFSLFVLIHRYVPDADVNWPEALVAAGCTAVLFAFGKELVTVYIGKSTVGSVFGPGRSVVILLLWAYFSFSVLLLGAELGRAYGVVRREVSSKPRA